MDRLVGETTGRKGEIWYFLVVGGPRLACLAKWTSPSLFGFPKNTPLPHTIIGQKSEEDYHVFASPFWAKLVSSQKHQLWGAIQKKGKSSARLPSILRVAAAKKYKVGKTKILQIETIHISDLTTLI